ncbi:MAG TPA: Uma2 family endonuclease [Thermoanaerobaculia bacterium]|nr:Uma2 family endonuclease [Thermoanaerobaculia bacterium]
MQPREERVAARRYNAPMAEPSRRLAGWSDVVAAPDGLKAEVIAGELFLMARPIPWHGIAQAALASQLIPRFHDADDGPGGWWIVIEPDVILGPHDIVSPDLVGWRRQRLPASALDRAVEMPPDWVCEVLSPSTSHRDRGSKADLYLRCGVAHSWLLDLSARLLEAFEAREGRWVRLGAWGPEQSARIPPFDAAELRLAGLFPPQEEPAEEGSPPDHAAPGAGEP